MKEALITVGLVALMLVSGTSNTISAKLQNNTCAHRNANPYAGKNLYVPYTHPWMQTLVMFGGEFSCLAMFAIQRYRERKEYATVRQSAEKARLLSPVDAVAAEGSEKLEQPKIFRWVFMIPACCDLFGTTVASVGLLFIPGSVWQLLRGSLVVFVAILSVIFLKKKMYIYNLIGLFTVVVGLVAVGASLLVEPQGSQQTDTGKLTIGVILVLVGQLISAIQFCIEDVLLSKRNFHPLHVVGMEGLFGLCLTMLVFIPLTFTPEEPTLPECGHDPGDPTGWSVFHDNFYDALVQMQNPVILIANITAFTGIAFYNYSGLMLSKRLSAVVRSLIDACRTLGVWLVELVIFYAIAHQHNLDCQADTPDGTPKCPHYGEGWKKYSWLQVIGFVLLVLGTLVYNAIIKLPCFNYDHSKPQKGGSGDKDDQVVN